MNEYRVGQKEDSEYGINSKGNIIWHMEPWKKEGKEGMKEGKKTQVDEPGWM